MKRFLIVALAVLGLAQEIGAIEAMPGMQGAAAEEYEPLQVTRAGGYRTVSDIAYHTGAGEYADERCLLDVYYPEGETDFATVVWFHGGGLVEGNKYVPTQLQNRGFAVVAVNYRLLGGKSSAGTDISGESGKSAAGTNISAVAGKAGNGEVAGNATAACNCEVAGNATAVCNCEEAETVATVTDIIDDAAAAVAWTLKNIENYGGSRAKVFVSGHSAGGYLTDMVVLDKSYLARYGVDADEIAGAFPLSAQVVTHFNVRKAQGIDPLQPTIDDTAPIAQMRVLPMPLFVLSGDRDLELFGRFEEQAYFWRMMKLIGNDKTYLYEFRGHDHGGMMPDGFAVMRRAIPRICAGKPALPGKTANNRVNH